MGLGVAPVTTRAVMPTLSSNTMGWPATAAFFSPLAWVQALATSRSWAVHAAGEDASANRTPLPVDKTNKSHKAAVLMRGTGTFIQTSAGQSHPLTGSRIVTNSSATVG